MIDKEELKYLLEEIVYDLFDKCIKNNQNTFEKFGEEFLLYNLPDLYKKYYVSNIDLYSNDSIIKHIKSLIYNNLRINVDKIDFDDIIDYSEKSFKTKILEIKLKIPKKNYKDIEKILNILYNDIDLIKIICSTEYKDFNIVLDK